MKYLAILIIIFLPLNVFAATASSAASASASSGTTSSESSASASAKVDAGSASASASASASTDTSSAPAAVSTDQGQSEEAAAPVYFLREHIAPVSQAAATSSDQTDGTNEGSASSQEINNALDKLSAQLEAINTKELNTADEIAKLEKQSVRILNLYLISLGALAIIFIIILVSLIIGSSRAPAMLN